MPIAHVAHDCDLPAAAPAVHHGVTCDRSGMCPIVGTRYHLPGQDYDLCQAEWDKLPPQEQATYERIERPDMRPYPRPIDWETISAAILPGALTYKWNGCCKCVTIDQPSNSQKSADLPVIVMDFQIHISKISGSDYLSAVVEARTACCPCCPGPSS